MSIKYTLKLLSEQWTYSEINKDRFRRRLIHGAYRERGLKVTTKKGFTFRAVSCAKNNFDVRIFTQTSERLLQWRTDKEKGDRLVHKDYRATGVERLSLDELFMDPSQVTEDDVTFFKGIYPELVEILVEFEEAVCKIDEILRGE